MINSIDRWDFIFKMSPSDLNHWDGCVYFILTDTDTETQVIQILISFATGKNIIGALKIGKNYGAKYLEIE